MKHSESIKPISYIKANAAEVIKDINESKKPLIVTQNGEAKVIIQDLESFEKMQDTMLMLKIIAQGRNEVEKKSVKSAKSAFSSIRKRVSKKNAA